MKKVMLSAAFIFMITLLIGCPSPTSDSEHVHTFTWTETQSATCTEAAVETQICSADSSHTGETRAGAAALGHNYVWTQTKAPTSTEKGSETQICSRDSSHVGETRDIDMLSPGEIARGPNIAVTGMTFDADSVNVNLPALPQGADHYVVEETSTLASVNAGAGMANLNGNTLNLGDKGIAALRIHAVDAEGERVSGFTVIPAGLQIGANSETPNRVLWLVCANIAEKASAGSSDATLIQNVDFLLWTINAAIEYDYPDSSYNNIDIDGTPAIDIFNNAIADYMGRNPNADFSKLHADLKTDDGYTIFNLFFSENGGLDSEVEANLETAIINNFQERTDTINSFYERLGGTIS
jgi:hypothetical protein